MFKFLRSTTTLNLTCVGQFRERSYWTDAGGHQIFISDHPKKPPTATNATVLIRKYGLLVYNCDSSYEATFNFVVNKSGKSESITISAEEGLWLAATYSLQVSFVNVSGAPTYRVSMCR